MQVAPRFSKINLSHLLTFSHHHSELSSSNIVLRRQKCILEFLENELDFSCGEMGTLTLVCWNCCYLSLPRDIEIW